MWKETRPSDNVLFYQDNAESTHFESESFDLIQYTYVIHEMPEVNAEMVINEAMRLLKPGGIFVGFEGTVHQLFSVRFKSVLYIF